MQFEITVCDLTGPIVAAHFHNDEAGKAGPVVRTITAEFNGNTASGVWKSSDAEPLTPELVSALLEGEIYVNVHTAANGQGEIRGQLGSRGFTAKIDTAQAVPPPAVSSKGSGTGSFSLNPAMNELKFDITVCDLTGTIAAAHFHKGAPGTPGPVVRTITGEFNGNTASGVWQSTDDEPLTDDLISDLVAGNLYINVHTAANGQGEIRGQINPAGLVTSVERFEDTVGAPKDFTLLQNFPNPFNPSTEIRFNLNQPSPTVLKIYNLIGQEVATLVDEELTAGSYKITFEPTNLPSGVYVYRLESVGQIESRKMILLK